MQFLADYNEGVHTVECVDCVQTLWSTASGITDQDMSDIVNKHAFMSHGLKAYASVHTTYTPTEVRPHLRTVSLAFAAPIAPELSDMPEAGGELPEDDVSDEDLEEAEEEEDEE